MAGEPPKRICGGACHQYILLHRAAFKRALPGQRATAAAKLSRDRFKALSADAKTKYQKMYEVAKQKYEKDLAAFLSAGGEMKARKSRKDKKVKRQKTQPSLSIQPVARLVVSSRRRGQNS